jgi:nucleotide-binding universal stress UspA family protein
MFRKLLLPVDLTDHHQAALKLAREMAGSGGEVVLLHVIEVISGVSLEDDRPFYTQLETAAREHLDRLRADLEGQKVSTRLEIRFGNRIAEIVRHAGEAKIDLVVLSVPPLTPEDPAASLESLSYKVSFFCPCPVLLVK